jgi:hypothetical protein
VFDEVNVAFRVSLLATGNAVVVQVATPVVVFTGWALHPVMVVGPLPYVKPTLPAAAGATVAVIVTLVP